MHRSLAFALLLAVFQRGHQEAVAFRSTARLSSRANTLQSTTTSSSSLFAARRTMLLERETTENTYDPLGLASTSSLYANEDSTSNSRVRPAMDHEMNSNKNNNKALWASSVAMVPFLLSEKANAVESMMNKEVYNPATFQPVCPTSDGFYRFLQTGIEAIVGREKFIEYGPLIAGGLLRVRLELCVVESFFNEAVGPFIKENGVSWILPLHETVETFLAGSIFALATTFILVGSTKLLTVITTYFDLLVGFPSRLFGGFFYDRALGRPVTLDLGFGPLKTRVMGPSDEVLEKSKQDEELVDLANPLTLLVVLTSGGIQLVGKVAGFTREFLEAVDLFVGRYLVFFATFYILIKFVHFKVFPDFP